MQFLRNFAAVISATILSTGMSYSQEMPKISIVRVNLPGAITIILDVLKERGIDKRHGIDLVVNNYATIAGMYAATSTGEVDISIAGPWVLQRMRNEDARIKAVFTFVGISSLGVVTGDPNLRTIQDLKGKTIAADMGSAEYLLLAAYGKAQGVTFGKDVTVVQASPPLARTQLDAGRVDAAMSWEVNATLMLQSNPKYRRMIGGETAWAGVTKSKTKGWQLVVTMHEDAIKKYQKYIPQLLSMWREAAQFMVTNTAEAELIVAKTVKLPPGVLKDALGARRLVYEINPAWLADKESLWENFRIGVENGYVSRLPDQGVLYTP